MTDSEPSPERLRRRFRRLAAQLGKTGWILLGTIHERRIPAPSPTRRNVATYGPYYQWTFKAAAKTRTVNLTREQARLWSQAIRNHRKLEKTIAEMRRVSLRILEETTTGVPRRGNTRGRDV